MICDSRIADHLIGLQGKEPLLFIIFNHWSVIEVPGLLELPAFTLYYICEDGRFDEYVVTLMKGLFIA